MFSRAAGWLLWCAVLSGCGASVPAVAPRHAATRPAVAGQTAAASQTEMPWSAGRRLVWSDFQGKGPVDGVEGARTVYQLSYASRCRGADFEFSVAALFLHAQSWVRPRVLDNSVESVRILRHEQTHFDLTEVYARRMRRFFQELYNPCGLLEDRLRESVDRFVREEAEAQQRYDKETGYGLVPGRQSVWDTEVAELLTSLARFAAN